MPNEFTPVGDRASIYCRNNVWYVNYQHGGRQVRRSLKTDIKREAIIRAQRIEADLARGDARQEVAISTIADVIEALLTSAESENRAAKTLAKYRFVTGQIRSLAEERRVTNIHQLNPQFADAFRTKLRKANRAAKTIYNAMVILRSVALFAMRRRMCDIDPLAGYKLQKPKPTTQPCWSPAEADAIVAAAPSTYRPYFKFLRETGCRAGEAKFLTWSDVDLGHRTIYIRSKEGWKPKSGDQRKVSMTEALVELLSSLPRAGRWVFTAPLTCRHPEAGRQLSERRALQALKRVLTRLKLDGHLHTFRHTFISQALMGGVPEAVVRQWVGHVDPANLRLYTHVADDVSQAYLRRFSEGGASSAQTREPVQ